MRKIAKTKKRIYTKAKNELVSRVLFLFYLTFLFKNLYKPERGRKQQEF